MNHRRRHRTRLAVAWAMMATGIAATPIGLWITDEPPAIVVMSAAALVFEGIIALLVVSDDGGGPPES